MTSLLDPVVELVMNGAAALLKLFINNRTEKAELQKLLARQQEEHATIARCWAEQGKRRSLRGFDLTGARLANVDLVKADLVEASFRKAELSEVNLGESNLTGADFSGAFLLGVDFSQANLNMADFRDATLRNVNFSQANLRGAGFSRAKDVTNCTWDGVYLNSQTQLNQEIRNRILYTQ
ncbi:MAG: pentapeptide repeat-containing protein [Anaerolineaceae bacterium]|nr:pentapeptide repeat-containing protein [Anaerolineaceae bacterium]